MSGPEPRAQQGGGRRAIAELVVDVAAPTVVLLFLSGEGTLGPIGGLVVALAFPLGHAVFTVATRRSVSALAVLAMVSVLLTGGIGLLELDVSWFAWKEAIFPLVMGVAAVVSVWTPWPIVPAILAGLLDPDKVAAALAERGEERAHAKALVRATWQIGALLVGTAVATFALARWLVTSATGTEAFNVELGQYTAVSFPVLGVLSLVGMVIVLRGVIRGIEDRTGCDLEDLLR